MSDPDIEVLQEVLRLVDAPAALQALSRIETRLSDMEAVHERDRNTVIQRGAKVNLLSQRLSDMEKWALPLLGENEALQQRLSDMEKELTTYRERHQLEREEFHALSVARAEIRQLTQRLSDMEEGLRRAFDRKTTAGVAWYSEEVRL